MLDIDTDVYKASWPPRVDLAADLARMLLISAKRTDTSLHVSLEERNLILSLTC